MNFELVPPRSKLVQVMNRLYYGGMTTLSGGNLSIRDADGSIWITPSGVDKGNLTEKDIVRVLPDGSVEGLHKPSSELPFHLAIYNYRPDVKSIVHAHAPALVSFSIVRKIPDTGIIPQARRVCGRVGYAPYALPGSDMLGENIARTFADGFDVVLLENHGAATVGSTLLEAYQRLETLDFCARSQLYAQSLGKTRTLTDDEIAIFDSRETMLPSFEPAAHTSRELDLRQQVVDVVQRACKRQLMISTEGVVSARVDEDSFLITPTGIDRPSITIDDVVLIRDGRRESGKRPSRSVRLHEAIYRRHPVVQCIITAQAPSVTAYAVAERLFDTKTIPESYVMLLDVPKLDYGLHFTAPDEVADNISDRHPVVLLQNDGVLVVGSTVLRAFDRLEVAEFTARSLIETASIGELVPIDDDEIRALEERFNLS